MNDRFVFDLLLAGCLLLAVLVFVELGPASDKPAPVAVADREPVAAPPQPHPRAKADDLIATILARPLFSTTRRPSAAEAGDRAADAELSDTRLAGILTEPGRRLAIFIPAGAKPMAVTEGDSVGGWRIDSITPLAVSLSGPGGSKTLQPKIDPNLAPPAPPPAPVPAAVNQVRGQAAAPVFPGRPAIRSNPPPVPPLRPGLVGARR
jgi:hypothetical protein